MKCVTILYCTLPCSKHDHIVSKVGDEVLPVQLHLVGVGDGELDELGLECSRGGAYKVRDLLVLAVQEEGAGVVLVRLRVAARGNLAYVLRGGQPLGGRGELGVVEVLSLGDLLVGVAGIAVDGGVAH